MLPAPEGSIGCAASWGPVWSGDFSKDGREGRVRFSTGWSMSDQSSQDQPQNLSELCRMCGRMPTDGKTLCPECTDWMTGLVNRWQKPLTSVAYYRLNKSRKRDAEDIVADAMYTCFKGMIEGTWRQEAGEDYEAFGRSLFTTVKNLSRNGNRKSQAASEADGSSPLPDPRVLSAPDAEFERSERREAVRAAVRRLPEYYRYVVVLRHMEGLSVKEVSRILDIREGTVKSRASRGMELLKVELASFIEDSTVVAAPQGCGTNHANRDRHE